MTATLFPPSLAGGLSIVVQGGPGVGKSTFAGSAAALGKTLLLAAKPREANSWKYREHAKNITREIYYDAKWAPAAGKFDADAFVRLQQRVYELQEDEEHSIVVCDPFTDVVTLASHEILKTEKAATPRDLRDPLSYYGTLKHMLTTFVQSLTLLQFAPSPKHVIVTVHVQPSKEDDIKGNATADKKGKGVEFEGNVLPMIEGSYRRAFASEFDVVLFSDIQFDRKLVAGKMQTESRYVVQVSPDAERHAKSILAPNGSAFIDNDFAALLKLVGG